MFYAFVIGGQTSGGQGNPIITIALIFTKGSNVTILNSIIYIVSQFMGAIVGGAIGI
jgi:glycerol uptake facilitator-like aquaporin